MRSPRRLLVAALLGCPLTAGGCGTVVNLALPINEEKTFGGIPADLKCMAKVMDSGPLMSGPSSGDGAGAVLLLAAVVVFPIVDLPLSFVGDTLTYPLAWWLDRRREGQSGDNRYPVSAPHPATPGTSGAPVPSREHGGKHDPAQAANRPRVGIPTPAAEGEGEPGEPVRPAVPLPHSP